MSFEYIAEVPTEDGEGTDEVILTFNKRATNIPSGIIRRNRDDQVAAMFAIFEWGLSADQLETLDLVPMSEMDKILIAWQEDSERDEDKPAGPPKAKKAKDTED
ncbi:hypothetical protein BN970_01372 [Mycolicibacterium conceptionense]|uniref:Tail assembly chaperone n=1 Tax=Mycolicibacterium conceptionense TaxID=451644 RepID=A0A0U1D501_9MYCO|nr:hypothetical protein [Mycolicibacterium conceptionense]ORV20966.1 hypothetical protein AWB98_01320 [Mycolicibacterium conceptionense]CQD07283.1 hypothetical protein BN970_01372 [Mycolicibacterium conceptionense]